MSNVLPKATQKKSKLQIDPTIKKGEIILANISFISNKFERKVEEVYKKPSDNIEYFTNNFKKRFKRKYKVDVSKITKIKIIKRLGFEHNNKNYSLGIKSEEKRDSKTGKYD